MYYNIPFICSNNLHGVQTNPSCMEGKRQTPGMHDQFPFIYSNNPTVPAYGVSIYISELIRYSREWVSYQGFHERVGYKTMGSKLGSSLRKFYNLLNLYGMFVSQMTTNMPHPVSLMNYHRILNMSYSMGVTNGLGSAYPSWVYIMVHDRCSTLLTEFGTALTTILPIMFQYCYTYCYSDSRNLWAVMKAGGLAL